MSTMHLGTMSYLDHQGSEASNDQSANTGVVLVGGGSGDDDGTGGSGADGSDGDNALGAANDGDNRARSSSWGSGNDLGASGRSRGSLGAGRRSWGSLRASRRARNRDRLRASGRSLRASGRSLRASRGSWSRLSTGGRSRSSLGTGGRSRDRQSATGNRNHLGGLGNLGDKSGDAAVGGGLDDRGKGMGLVAVRRSRRSGRGRRQSRALSGHRGGLSRVRDRARTVW